MSKLLSPPTARLCDVVFVCLFIASFYLVGRCCRGRSVTCVDKLEAYLVPLSYLSLLLLLLLHLYLIFSSPHSLLSLSLSRLSFTSLILLLHFYLIFFISSQSYSFVSLTCPLPVHPSISLWFFK